MSKINIILIVYDVQAVEYKSGVSLKINIVLVILKPVVNIHNNKDTLNN